MFSIAPGSKLLRIEYYNQCTDQTPFDLDSTTQTVLFGS